MSNHYLPADYPESIKDLMSDAMPYLRDQVDQWQIAALPVNRYNLNQAQQDDLDRIKGTFQDTGKLHSLTYNLKIA